MGVLIIRRSPGPVVVEGSTALTMGAGGVVLADTGIVDLGEGPSVIKEGVSKEWPRLDLPFPSDLLRGPLLRVQL